MAQLNQPFNAHNVDPTQGVGGFPVGKHIVQIIESDIKATKSGDSGMLELVCEVLDGDAKGTTGAYRLNIYNTNPQAAEIAKRQLSAVCHVTGVFQLDDTRALHNIPFMIEVKPQKNDPQYTEVSKVYDTAGNEPGKQGQGGGNAGQQGGGNQGGGQQGGWGGNNGGGNDQGNQGNNQGGGGWGGGNNQGNDNQGGNDGGNGGGGWNQGNNGGGGKPSWGG